jgi:predicted AAA+ superfamily ATPase
MIDAYVNHFDLQLDRGTLLSEAKEWSVTRGSRSGRVAWQFIQDLAGRQGKKLD